MWTGLSTPLSLARPVGLMWAEVAFRTARSRQAGGHDVGGGGVVSGHYDPLDSKLMCWYSFSMGRPQHAQKSPVDGRITAAPLDSM